MASYSIEFRSSAERDLRSLGRQLIERVLPRIEELAAQAADLALHQKDMSRRGLQPYARLLNRHYGSLFHGLRTVKRLAMGPRTISILVHKAQNKPYLAQMIASLTMATASPWMAFTPRVWWDILT